MAGVDCRDAASGSGPFADGAFDHAEFAAHQFDGGVVCECILGEALHGAFQIAVALVV